MLFPEVMSITRKFSDEQFGILMRAAFSYRFTGEVYSGDDVAVDVAFQAVASQIDRYKEFCNTLSNNAKCISSKQSAAKVSKSQQSDPPIQSISNPCPIQSIESKADKPPIRHKYGSYKNVLFTDEEYAKLQAEFPGDYSERIERLSEYIASTGKSYKSHLATIRSWARKDGTKAGSMPSYGGEENWSL